MKGRSFFFIKKYYWVSILFVAGILFGASIIKFKIFPYQAYIYLRDINRPKIFQPYSKKEIDSFQYIFSKKLVVSPTNIDSARIILCKYVLGSNLLPNSIPNEITPIIDRNYIDINGLHSIEQYKIELTHGFISSGYIFHPTNSINRLILYYQGHDGGFFLGKSTIEYFLEKGYTVYAFSLPLLGMNNQPIVKTKKYGTIQFTSNHDYFKFLPNPLSFFIAPVIVMINYSTKFKFENTSMVGISGGGWATTIASALDKRINFSFPVAGTYPNLVKFIRPEHNYGDYEQTIPSFMENFDYLDLYLMGSVGKKRVQIQILNLYDPCCFNGYEYQLYSEFLKSEIKKYKTGKFIFFSDSLNKSHSISLSALNVISSEINLQSKKQQN